MKIKPFIRICLFFSCLLFFFCKSEVKKQKEESSEQESEVSASQPRKNDVIWCDLDGDGKDEKVEIILKTQNNKSGLRVTYGKGKKVDEFGFGKDVLEQGFDDFNWVGVFEKAPKGKIYWNNVNEDGEIKTEEEYTDADKFVLKNDGIFIHQLESCGGGIIYLEEGLYKWFQQE